MKRPTSLAIAGIALAIATAASSPAQATLVAGYGTMTFTNLTGSATLNSGTSLLATSSVTIPSGTLPRFGNNFYLQSKSGVMVGSVYYASNLPVTTGVTGGGTAPSR